MLAVRSLRCKEVADLLAGRLDSPALHTPAEGNVLDLDMAADLGMAVGLGTAVEVDTAAEERPVLGSRVVGSGTGTGALPGLAVLEVKENGYL